MRDRLFQWDLTSAVVAGLLVLAMVWAAVQLGPIAAERWF